MTTATEYVEKSDNRNVLRGHNRWLRAAINATLRPNSQAAKLYRSRVAVAESIAGPIRAMGVKETGYRHVRSYHGPETKFYTCSIYCAAMVAQLDVPSNQDRVLRYLAGDSTPERRGNPSFSYSYTPDSALALNRATLSRSVQCACCGSTIKKK